MCLILFAYRFHPEYELLLAVNRDEYYDRPTALMVLGDFQERIYHNAIGNRL